MDWSHLLGGKIRSSYYFVSQYSSRKNELSISKAKLLKSLCFNLTIWSIVLIFSKEFDKCWVVWVPSSEHFPLNCTYKPVSKFFFMHLRMNVEYHHYDHSEFTSDGYRWLGGNQLSGSIPDMGTLKELKTLYVLKVQFLFIYALFFHQCWLITFVDRFVQAFGEQPASRFNSGIISKSTTSVRNVSLDDRHN